MAYRIVTDSSCNLPEDLIDRYGLEILPLTFMIDGVQHVSYLKGEHTDLQQFYKMMRDGKVITTSLPNVAESTRAIRAILEAGDDVLYLGFSSALSGTHESTKAICAELAQEFPERTITCVGTRAASGGEGLLVLYAAELREEGSPIEEVAQWVRDNRLRLAHWFTVDDLMYLYRGGRVSRTSATAGSILNIKPVLHVDDEGRLIPREKVRGRKRSLEAMLSHMKSGFSDADAPQHVMITHGDCIEDVKYLKGRIEEEFDSGQIADIIVNYVDPVIGAHSGPGTMALFYLADSRN